MDFAFDEVALNRGKAYEDWLLRELDMNWGKRFRMGTPEWVAFQKDWDRKSFVGGWAGLSWPVRFGGLGATASERACVAAISARYGAPEGFGKIGKRMVARMLMEYGTQEQQERHLPGILRGEKFWCQGFSEPNAGSDLASIKTKAVIDGDHFVVNGQKIWTSFAHEADWCFMLVRTAPSGANKHAGISALLVSLDLPGVEVRPIRQIDRGVELAEVFLDDARVPRNCLVGPLDGGWQVALSLLQHERGVELAFARASAVRASLDRAIADLHELTEREYLPHAGRIGQMQAACFAIHVNALRLTGAQLHDGKPDAMSSLVRLQSSETWREVAWETTLIAPETAILDHGWLYAEDYLHSRHATIAGGTSQIQRNIIASRVLGMDGKGRQ